MAMVVFGGYPMQGGGGTMNTMKRKWKKIMNVSSSSIAEIASHRPTLAFEDNDFPDGKANKYIPLLMKDVMANFEVRRILVDQGSLANITFIDLLKTLGISEEDLSTDLSGFNGSKNKTLDYLELMVTYGEEPLALTVKTPFLVLPCKSVYNYVISQPTLGRL